MSIKTFMKKCNKKDLKKMDKEDRVKFVYGEADDILDLYITKAHKQPDTINKVFELMSIPLYIKTLRKAVKKSYIDPNFVTVLFGLKRFLENEDKDLSGDEVEIIDEIIETLTQSRVKKLDKKFDISEEDARELLSVIPTREFMAKYEFISRILVSKLIRKMYYLAKTSDFEIDSSKDAKELFSFLLGNDYVTVAMSVLLREKKDTMRDFNDDQKELWGILTSFALEELEEKGKKEITNYLEYYADERRKDDKKNRDGARRVSFTQLVPEDYKAIVKASTKLVDKKPELKKYI